jgi:uncharacterized alpha-E superfamily protein
MLSRVADSIYWMSRYIERAENVARFLDVNLHLMLDLAVDEHQRWDPLVASTGDHEAFQKRHGTATQANVTHFLTFDKGNPNSILSSLRAARQNARCVREIISSEMWEQINKFYLMVQGAAGNGHMHSPHEFFTQVKMASHLFAGVTDATMSHAEAWHFARLGRLLERADKTSRILDVKYFMLYPRAEDVGTPYDNLQWASLLRSTSSLEMYRKRFQLISPRKVADFLILDREFPRAIHYCVIKAEESLHAITGSPAMTFRDAAEQRIGRLRSELDFADVNEIIDLGLHKFLDNFQTKLNLVGEAVFETFFALGPQPAKKEERKAEERKPAMSMSQSQSQK